MNALIRKLRDRYDAPSGIRPDKDTDPDVLALCDEYERIEAAICKVHEQRADDRCWMDIDALFALVGLPTADRRVGDKAAMLENCRRFVETQCEGGGWRSYAELEAELLRIEALLVEWGEATIRVDEGQRRLSHILKTPDGYAPCGPYFGARYEQDVAIAAAREPLHQARQLAVRLAERKRAEKEK
jgi:hypothetical protein